MENATIAVLILISGAFAMIFFVLKAISVGKKGVDVGINRSKEMLSTISEKIEIKKQEELEYKLRNIVADELVRELVRKAIREKIDPDTYQPCDVCLGEGCAKCNNRGWLKS